MNDRVSLDPLPYYKWHWLRWRASRKVQRMSILERGIYRELLDEQWAQGCIRDEADALSEILDDSQQVLAIAKQVLSKCFTEISPSVWQNLTLEEQRTENDKLRSKRKIAGTLGALAKAKSPASAEQVLASAEQVPYREREEREEKRGGSGIDPNQMARGLCERLNLSRGMGKGTVYEAVYDLAMQEAARDGDLEALCDRMEEAFQRWQGTELEYRWSVAKFFGEGHWAKPDTWPRKEGKPEQKKPRILSRPEAQ